MSRPIRVCCAMMTAITVEMLIWAYARGMFPMAQSRHGQIEWYTADPRGILPLDQFHIPRSLQKRIRQGTYHITINTAFDRVIHACATPRYNGDETWINDQIIDAFCDAHAKGLAHSIEAWNRDRELVGGVYGLALGGAFFGESMFSTATDASKCCLAFLVDHLNTRRFALFDAQFHNPHLEQFGLTEIAADEYMKKLEHALTLAVRFVD